MTQEIINRLKEAAGEIDDAYIAADEEPCRCNVDELSCPHCNAWDRARRFTEETLLSTLTNLTPSGVERIRAEAFEEAAKVADRCSREYGVVFCDNPAAAVRDEIRALALPSEPPQQLAQGDVESASTPKGERS